MEQRAGVAVPDQRPQRDLDDGIRAVLAEAALGAAGLAVLGGIFPLIAKVQQRGHVGVGDKDDIAAPAAVAAVRPAGRHIFFPVEADVAIAAAARPDPDLRNIYKHIFSSFSRCVSFIISV